MSVADDLNSAGTGFLGLPSSGVPATSSQRPLHRVSEIRRRQGISLRSAARRMGTSLEQVRQQERSSCDLTLSELHQWQQALEVPLAELLIDLDPPLSEPVLTRARLLKIMKTVRALKELSPEDSLQRMCNMLEEQLVQLMPELKEVTAWHSVGQRRTQDELGRVAERSLPDTFFSEGTQ